MDPWVVSSVLSLNLAECNYMSQSLIHTMSVESFLDRVEKTEGEALVSASSQTRHLHPTWALRLLLSTCEAACDHNRLTFLCWDEIRGRSQACGWGFRLHQCDAPLRACCVCRPHGAAQPLAPPLRDHLHGTLAPSTLHDLQYSVLT